MTPIHPISPISSILCSCAVDLLLEAAIGEEFPVEPFHVSLQEDIFLVDERNGDIGDGLVTPTWYLLPIDSRVEVGAAESACRAAARIIVAPLPEVAHTEVVLVVEA